MYYYILHVSRRTSPFHHGRGNDFITSRQKSSGLYVYEGIGLDCAAIICRRFPAPLSSISSQRVIVRRKNDVILRIRHQDLGWCHGSLAERSGNQQCTFGRRHQLNGMENNSLSLKYLELLLLFLNLFKTKVDSQWTRL